jgi:hypothetical protein
MNKQLEEAEKKIKRNKNPHKEAVVAEYVFAAKYKKYSLYAPDSLMDFYDTLSTYEKVICRRMVDAVVRAKGRDAL